MLQSASQPIGQVNELASFTLDLSIQDDAGLAAIPTTLEWRLLCVETDTELQAFTSLTPSYVYDDFDNVTAVTAEIVVDGSLNEMQTSGLGSERKALIIVANRGSGEYSLECTYNVIRLYARS